ncbi:MAG: hypothetical protein NTV46_01695 [Verrucomicrobia bacterium]|nr:hypothetical protein [Verrucomicrobiota bacterium]
MNLSRSIWCLLALLPVACASHDDANKPAASDTHKPLSQRLEEKNGYKQDAKGNWVPRNDKRSSFETQKKSPHFQGDYQKKNYQTNAYAKKSWWGDKEYGRTPYSGNTDASRFKKSSPLTGQGARESGTAAAIPDPYQTGTYATHAAREAGRSNLAKPSDTQTDIRRRVYKEPEIIDWKEQRSLSMEQSKGILGH